MRCALDTNILVYAEGVNDVIKRDAITDLLARLPGGAAIVPVQVLGELFNVLVRKAGLEPSAARKIVLNWHDAYDAPATTITAMIAAFDLVADHKFRIWDALVLAAAAEAGCRLVLSEDLQDGFTWRGVTVVNPFAFKRHALLEGLLG